MAPCNPAGPAYGRAFLELGRAIYPGYHAHQAFGIVIVGTLYACVGRAIFGRVYNCCVA